MTVERFLVILIVALGAFWVISHSYLIVSTGTVLFVLFAIAAFLYLFSGRKRRS